MGQQQLILLVLATVIVGVAIVVGIRAFTENSVKSVADAMTQESVKIANDLQAWKKKPAPFGGQTGAAKSDPADFSGLASVKDLGYTEAGGVLKYETLNGCYEIIPEAGGATIKGFNGGENVATLVTVSGMTDTSIEQTADYPKLGDAGTADATSCAAPTTTP